MTTVEKPTTEDYKLISKVASNSYVNTLWENALGYYNTAKGKSDFVKRSCETLETSVERGVKWAEPALHSDMVKKYEPYLHTVDDFGCRTYDQLGNLTEKLSDSYTSSKQVIEQRVNSLTNDVKATTSSFVEVSRQTLEEKVIPPVDSYLKNSIVGVPISAVVDLTQKVCDKYIPADEDDSNKEGKQEDDETEEVAGPMLRASNISKRVQKEMFKKLQNLSMRPPEAREALKYSVNLIEYAASQIDAGAKTANHYISDSISKTKDSLHKGYEVSVTQAREGLDKSTHEALEKLQTAMELLNSYVPPKVASTAQNSYEILKQQSSALVSRIETSKDLQAFAELAKKNTEKLQEAIRTLNSHASSTTNTILQTPLVASVTATIQHVLDSFFSFKKPKTLAIEQNETQPEEKQEKMEETEETENRQ